MARRLSGLAMRGVQGLRLTCGAGWIAAMGTPLTSRNVNPAGFGAFSMLARTGCLSPAGREPGVTTPVASKRQTLMEQRARLALINLTTRRMSLTPEGEVCLEHARRIVGGLDELARSVWPPAQGATLPEHTDRPHPCPGETMMQTARLCLLALLLVAPILASAQTLRWAARGDVGSMDPHSFNEGLTDNLIGHVYEQLGRRARDHTIEPALAERWTVVDDTTWRFTMRAGVHFSDGTPLTAADAVFSIERAQQASSQQAFFARQLGRPVLIDERSFELRLDKPNPLLLEHQLNVRIMSAAWCKANGAEKVPNFSQREEGHSTRHAMGTGPFVLQRFEPGVRVTLTRNKAWWDRFDGNVQTVVYTPIGNDATRTSALLSGGVDFVHDTPPQDIERMQREPAVKLVTGPENRILFFVPNLAPDELAHASVKGRNPFRDVRVREAFALAIDAEAIRARTMRGQSQPTACLATADIGCIARELETRPAADPARARRLLADAGYPKGFELTIDCPNDRYVNDQAICLASAAMLARVGVRARVDARPKTVFFQKIERFETSFYLLGWGGGTTDPQGILDPIARRPESKTQKGSFNYGKVGDAELDALIDAAGSEMNAQKRAGLLAAAQRRVQQQHHVLPIHRQMITWAVRRNVQVTVMPDNALRAQWVTIE